MCAGPAGLAPTRPSGSALRQARRRLGAAPLEPADGTGGLRDPVRCQSRVRLGNRRGWVSPRASSRWASVASSSGMAWAEWSCRWSRSAAVSYVSVSEAFRCPGGVPAARVTRWGVRVSHWLSAALSWPAGGVRPWRTACSTWARPWRCRCR
ncbi:hypothetical protein ACWEQC_35110 [Streptomyces shenzhenensis]